MRRATAQRLSHGLLRSPAPHASSTVGKRSVSSIARYHNNDTTISSTHRAQPGTTALSSSRPTPHSSLRPHQTQRSLTNTSSSFRDTDPSEAGTYSEADREHAVISTFDLFSIGIGPSSSHTVGPMRAGNIFVSDLLDAGLLRKVHKIRVTIYGSLALTGEGHMTPSALLLGLESANVETVDTFYVPKRFEEIKATGKIHLGQGLGEGKGREIDFEYKKDFIWEWSKKLPLHSNGMRLMVFDENGDMLATNDMFSVGGGFVVNGAMSTAANAAIAQDDGPTGQHPVDLVENVYYKEIKRSDASGDRLTGAEIIAPPEAELEGGENTSLLNSGYAKGEEQSAMVAGKSSEKDITHATAAEQESSPEGQQPRYPFRDAASLLAMCKKHNLTIAQLVYENEKSNGYTDEEIHDKLFKIWEVMDNSILEAVQAPMGSVLPGSLKLSRRAPGLYRRLTRGLYPSTTERVGGAAEMAQLEAAVASSTTHSSGSLPSEALSSSSSSSDSSSSKPPTSVSRLKSSVPHIAPSPIPQPTTRDRAAAAAAKRNFPTIHGSLTHAILPSPSRRTAFPAMDYLTVYAIAVNETNACGGRVVTAPTNGAAGIIPSVLKYTLEFISDTSDHADRDIVTFLLTAAAIGMIFKRGATISAAEGGCMAEVGVACSMAAAGFAAVHGASVETIEMAAEIGIEHNLGLSCDPIASLVQAPCIERNALGSIKAVSSANLALSSNPQTMKVRLDDAVRAMRLTAEGMRSEFKETSLSGLATSVPIPVSVPDC